MTAGPDSGIFGARMSDDTEDVQISIGAVSQATGIPVETLRTWERRYGFPDPDRNDAGHRRYERNVISRLRLTERAVEAGYRPSNVVGMTEDDLRELLGTADLEDAAGDRVGSDVPTDLETDREEEWLDEWLEASSQLDGDALVRGFRHAWNRLGGLEFLCQRAAPFLEAVGNEWASGGLAVVHEHYTSEVLRDFLSARWRPRSSRSRGPTAVLATPQGEQHALGLHLVATVFAIADWQVVFIGPDTPHADILEAARSRAPDAVAISISASYRERRAALSLDDLADKLPDDVLFVAGGRGVPKVDTDVETFASLDALYDWAFDYAH